MTLYFFLVEIIWCFYKILVGLVNLFQIYTVFFFQIFILHWENTVTRVCLYEQVCAFLEIFF